MLVVADSRPDELTAVVLFCSFPPSGSWPSPDLRVDAGGLSLSLPPPVAADNELLVVAAATVDADGTELESSSPRMKFTYVFTNPVELNFGRQMGIHDAEAELL